MERHLRGGDHVQPSICIHIGISAEGLHHGLLVRFCVVYTVDHIVAGLKDRIHIPRPADVVGTQVSLVVRADIAEASPVILRVHKDRIILRLPEVQYRFQHLILDLHKLHRLLNGFLGSARDDGRSISDETHSLIQDQAVIGARLRVSLSCQSEPLVRTVFVGKYTLNSRHCLRAGGIDLLDQRMGMGTSDDLHDQAVRRCKVVCIDRPARDQCLCVNLCHRMVHHSQILCSLCIHTCASFLLARYFSIARSWPI